MAGLWQRTGNVTVTNGSKTVTGFGTKWKTGVLPIQKGHTFYGPDNAAYEVDTVVSDDSILLVDAYRGGTLANQAYRIDITRTSTISQFAADLASLVAKYRVWFDGMMSWLTGSGDVSILNPDTGANTTIPSWKKVASEGEGQATRAKAEADKATAAANLAVNVVRDAALPLPDVWLPLNDSLKLLGGNGREVLVGSDVVARYADFTRASTAWYFDKSGVLRQAAINEPRFEPAGLLIEGQSTNLLRWDEVRTAAGAGVLTTVTSEKYPGITAKKVTGGNVTTALGASRENIKDSTVYTSTMIVDLANSNIPNGRFRFAFAYSAAWPGRYLTVDVNALTATPYDANTIGAVKRVGDLLIVTATTTSAAAASSSGGGSLDVYYLDSAGIPAVPPANGSMCIVGFQLEELGFASSFIPTTASAATRSPDVCSIPGTKNRTRFGELTIAIECSVPDDGITRAIDNVIGGRAICLLDDNPDTQLYLRNRSGRYYHFEYGSDYKNTTSLEEWVRNFTYIGRISGPTEETRTRTIGINGVLTASSSAYTHNPGVVVDKIYIGSAANTNHLFGCVRNIRIWQRALTDAQCKVIR